MLTLKEVERVTIPKHTEGCVAAIGSVTQAMKAQKALGEAAIPTTVIKLEASSPHRGCIFGVRYSCVQENNVKTILGAARISVKEWTHAP